MNDISTTVQLRFHKARMIRYAGQVYRHPFDVITELVSNELDAGGKHLMVYLHPSRIIVIGDGEGMVPKFLEADRQAIYEFLEAPHAMSYDELVAKLGVASLHSLEWMATCIALSEKFLRNDRDARGMKGVGALAYLSIAKQQVITSRPSLDLAQRYWGIDLKIQQAVPAYSLLLPGADALDSGDLTGFIQCVKALRDPWGKPMLTQGTRVEITDLRERVIDQLKPKLLVEHLARTFSDELESGIKIQVIDHCTREGQSRDFAGGIPHDVQPPSQRIAPFINEIARTDAGETFRVTLYHDPHGHAVPQVRRKGKSFDITLIDGLNRSPWSSGEWFGQVHFLDLPPRRADKLWDTAKGSPLPSAERNRWIKALRRYEDAMSKHMEEDRRRSQDESTQHIRRALNDAISKAVKDMDFLRDESILTVAGGHERPAKEGSSSRSHDALTRKINYVRGSVMSEHGEGVVGVTLQLWQDLEMLEEKSTGLGGHTSFGQRQDGKYPDGRYMIRIVVPQGMAPVNNKIQEEFVLHHEHRPGAEIIFHLQTNAGPRVKSKLSSVRIETWFRAGIDPDEPWQHRFDEGHAILIINLDGEALKPALDAKDYDRVRLLLSVYTANALCDGFVEGPKQMVLLYASRLAARIDLYLRDAFTRALRKLVQRAKR